MDIHHARLFVVTYRETVTREEFCLLELHVDAECGVRSLCPRVKHHQHHILACCTRIDEGVGVG